MADVRLIERLRPIAEVGVESTRERMPMTPFPARTASTSGGRGVRWRRRGPPCRPPLPRETRTDDVEWREGSTSCGRATGVAGWAGARLIERWQPVAETGDRCPGNGVFCPHRSFPRKRESRCPADARVSPANKQKRVRNRPMRAGHERSQGRHACTSERRAGGRSA